MSLTVGSLFSGIGGFDLGLERAGMSVRWQVENNDYCRRVLAKHWPSVPCYGDIKAINWEAVEPVDLVCGGFPCQPFSLAGKQRGKNDDRYLWPEVVRCLGALRPAWFLGENVPGIINLALDQVCTDLESLGYQVWPVCIPACAVDAPHIRQRVWIVAHADKNSEPNQSINEQRQIQRSMDVAHTHSTGLQGYWGQYELRKDCEEWEISRKDHDVAHTSRELLHGTRPRRARRGKSPDSGQWPFEPNVGRVAHGVSHRVDRLRGLGNAIVPHIAEAFGEMILVVHHKEVSHAME